MTLSVRVRPFSEKERLLLQPNNSSQPFTGDGSFSYQGKATASFVRPIVQVLDERILVFDPPETNPITKYQRAILPQSNNKRVKDVRYAFDRVFDDTATQEEVYEHTTKHLMDGILDGFNSTVFAYGATGCGKTHTISGTPDSPGIIFLTMQELFDRINNAKDEKSIELSLTYLEIYNETIRDLLSPGGCKQGLALREDSNERIVVAGLSEHSPTTVDEVMEMILLGNQNRTMSPTEANATSSRSHAVLQVNVKQKSRTAGISEDHTVATLSIIDLAGSERASVTKNRGERLLEGANINKSLLALGNCINALCDVHRKTHVPYRNSKLTRLLKFSLGGNCKTVMIVCVSPSSIHYDETHNTLKYANRAKNIKTKVSRNLVSVDRHVSQYVKVIYELRQEIEELRSKLDGQEGVTSLQANSAREAGKKVAIECVSKLRYSHDAILSNEIDLSAAAADLEVVGMKIDMMTQWTRGISQTVSLDSSSTVAGAYHVVNELLQDLHRQRLDLMNKVKSASSSAAIQEQTWQTVQRRLKTSNVESDEVEAVERERDILILQTDKARMETQLRAYAAAMSQQSQMIAKLLRSNAESMVDVSQHEGSLRILSEIAGRPVADLSPAPTTPSRLSVVPAWKPSPRSPRRQSIPAFAVGKMSSPLRVHKVGTPRKSVVFRTKAKKIDKKRVRWRDEEHDTDLAESVHQITASSSSDDSTPPPLARQKLMNEAMKENSPENDVSPLNQRLSLTHSPSPLREVLNTPDSMEESDSMGETPDFSKPRRTSIGQIGKKRRASHIDPSDSGGMRRGLNGSGRITSPKRTKAVGMNGMSLRISAAPRRESVAAGGKPTWR